MQTLLVKAHRKQRVLATTTELTVQLGRSARQLSRKSVKRIQQAAIAKRLTQLVQLAMVENACKLMRADLLIRLVEDDGLRAIDIARATGLRQAGQLHVHPVSNPRR